MALRHLLMLCSLTALALSGCASDPDPAPDVADAPAGSSRQAPLAVGDDAGDGSIEARPAGEVLVTPFSKDGMTAVGACGYAAVVGRCAFPYSDNALFVKTEGTATRLAGAMTWEARADYTLRVFLLVQDGEGVWRVPKGYGAAHDTDGSLEFDWDVAELEDDDFVLAANAFYWNAAMAGGAGFSLPFEFHLEGQAESLVAS